MFSSNRLANHNHREADGNALPQGHLGLTMRADTLSFVADFVFGIARRDEKTHNGYTHACQSSSIFLEYVLSKISDNARMVLLDFTQDCRKTTGVSFPNNVHYAVKLGLAFVDACPNLYLHQGRDIAQGLALTPESPHNDLYQRYRDALDYGNTRSDWRGLSLNSIRDSDSGGQQLIERYEQEVEDFTQSLKNHSQT